MNKNEQPLTFSPGSNTTKENSTMSGISLRLSRSSVWYRTLFAVALPSLLLTTLSAKPAHATGMQGHIYMSHCALEQIPQGRIKTILGNHFMRLSNGAFFPDSGYAVKTNKYGEPAHWEQFIEGYIQYIRTNFKSPYTDPESQKHIAFVMGAAAHGITDSTFDTLYYSRIEQVDPASADQIDTAMDIFLDHQLQRNFQPEFDYDLAPIVQIYKTDLAQPTEEKTFKDGLDLAWSGISATINILSFANDEFVAKYPWGSAHLLDARTPGAYAFGSQVVIRYWEEILKRLDGDQNANGIVIGTYPNSQYPLVTLDKSRVDSKIVFFFGHGIDRDSVTDTTFQVYDKQGNLVPTTLQKFRGDKWLNAVMLQPTANWSPATEYRVVLSKSIKNLYGNSPDIDFELNFKSPCAPGDTSAGCPPEIKDSDPKPASPCPNTDAQYVRTPDPPDETDPPIDTVNPPGPTTEPTTNAASSDTGGCSLPEGSRPSSPWSWLPLGLLGIAAAWRWLRKSQS
jgi:hypothetical protein